MTKSLSEISDELAKVKWINIGDKASRTLRDEGKLVLNTEKTTFNGWPAEELLTELFKNPESDVAEHTNRVIASVNQIIDSEGREEVVDGKTIHHPYASAFFAPLNYDKIINTETRASIKNAINNPQITGKREEGTGGNLTDIVNNASSFFRRNVKLDEGEESKAYLRVLALFHDIGKIIGSERHVKRGVHLICNQNDKHRKDIENLFDNFIDKRNFWSILQHHDIYGNLNTGEASLLSFSDILSWTTFAEEDGRKPIDYLSYLLWLNVADADASLSTKDKDIKGISHLEALRYFSDWEELKAVLTKEIPLRNRKDFKTWSIQMSVYPSSTIRRISRLIETSYTMEMDHDLLDSYIVQECPFGKPA